MMRLKSVNILGKTYQIEYCERPVRRGPDPGGGGGAGGGS